MDAKGEGKDAAQREKEREREVAKPDPLTSFKGTALFIESNVHETPLPHPNGRPTCASVPCNIRARSADKNDVRIIHLVESYGILEGKKKREFSMEVNVSFLR